jgi:hypothetical protein
VKRRPSFVVLRVNGDDTDTHAHPIPESSPATVDAAIKYLIDNVALPDPEDELSFAIVNATDAGAARISRAVSRWYPYLPPTAG